MFDAKLVFSFGNGTVTINRRSFATFAEVRRAGRALAVQMNMTFISAVIADGRRIEV